MAIYKIEIHHSAGLPVNHCSSWYLPWKTFSTFDEALAYAKNTDYKFWKIINIQEVYNNG